jgi:protein required for attachment to host cells
MAFHETPLEGATMSKYIVVVADSQRARLFSLQESLTPEVESSPRLIEEQALLNDESANVGAKTRRPPAKGRNQTGSGGSYSFDNHQNKRLLDELRKFSGVVIKEALKQAKKASAHTLVLVAEQKTLGVIRAAVASIKQKGVQFLECDLELTGETPIKIQALLAKRKLIPAMKRPSQQVRK